MVPYIIKGFFTTDTYHTVFLKAKIKIYKQNTFQFAKHRLKTDSEENICYPNKEQWDMYSDGDNSQRETGKLTPND